MLKRLLYIAIFTFSLQSCRTIEYIPDYSSVEVLNTKEYFKEEKEFTLIMTAGVGCGYCNQAMKDLLIFDKSPKLNIVVAEFGNPMTIKRYHQRYLDKYLFINPKDGSVFPNDFYPIFQLYKGKELIWGYEGYKKEHIVKIKSYLKE
ncbi:hypothetical protein [Aureivirga sp. CE67]|uniref:hypothetical protein n=1 Tax=Aureivirga sp. CE67 TaxID=1788983 RepID=UPI0018CBB0BD|nr:hypothetical protein [Aureivirga sp. CE67]